MLIILYERLGPEKLRIKKKNTTKDFVMLDTNILQKIGNVKIRITKMPKKWNTIGVKETYLYKVYQSENRT